MNLRSFLTSAVFFLSSAAGLSATTVEINGDFYILSDVEGSFEANSELLMSQVWWGSFSLSLLFAEAVVAAEGEAGTAWFAYRFYRSSEAEVFGYGAFGLDFAEPTIFDFSDAGGWKTAELVAVPSVPLPASSLLLLSGLVAVAMRRKKKPAP